MEAVTRTTDLRTEVVTVDPDTAREWLETMVNNRKVSRPNLDSLMEAMIEGRWHQDGSSIKFDKAGRLIDGQHRLWALINTGQTLTFTVTFGVDTAAMTTLDTGKSRTRGDILLIHDPTLRDVTAVSSAASIMLRWHRGARNNALRNMPLSNDAVVKFYDENRDDIIAAQKHGSRLNRATGAGSGMAFALCHWMFSMLDESDAEFFWDRLIDGQGLEVGNPIYALRELLRREAAAPTTREKMRADILVALIIKAWNSYRRGEEIKLLHFKVGGAHPERYPEPI